MFGDSCDWLNGVGAGWAEDPDGGAELGGVLVLDEVDEPLHDYVRLAGSILDVQHQPGTYVYREYWCCERCEQLNLESRSSLHLRKTSVAGG